MSIFYLPEFWFSQCDYHHVITYQPCQCATFSDHLISTWLSVELGRAFPDFPYITGKWGTAAKPFQVMLWSGLSKHLDSTNTQLAWKNKGLPNKYQRLANWATVVTSVFLNKSTRYSGVPQANDPICLKLEMDERTLWWKELCCNVGESVIGYSDLMGGGLWICDGASGVKFI